MRYFADTAFNKIAHFAKAMAVTPPTLYPYFRGEKEPGATILLKMAELGCNAHWLLTGEGEMYASNDAGNRLMAEHGILLPRSRHVGESKALYRTRGKNEQEILLRVVVEGGRVKVKEVIQPQ